MCLGSRQLFSITSLAYTKSYSSVFGLRGSVFIRIEELEATAAGVHHPEKEKTWKYQNYISKNSEKLQAKNRKNLDQDKLP
jgi:hypothetical protein